jgi:hypothetical protein
MNTSGAGGLVTETVVPVGAKVAALTALAALDNKIEPTEIPLLRISAPSAAVIVLLIA